MKFFTLDISQRTLNRKIVAFMRQVDADKYANFLKHFQKPQCLVHTTVFLYCVWQTIKAQYSPSEHEPMDFNWLDQTMRRLSSWNEDIATLDSDSKTNFQYYIELLISFLEPFLNKTLAQTDIEPFLSDMNGASAKRKFSIATHFSAADLVKQELLALFTQDNQFILICSSKHAMGLVRLGKTTILYNPDSEQFAFFKTSEKQELAEEIFKGSGYDSTYSYPLGFIVFGNENNQKNFPAHEAILSHVCLNPPPTNARQQYTNAYSPLHIAVKIACVNSILHHLLSGESIETPAVYGMTSLHLAFIENHKFIVEFFLTYGANMDAHLESGATLLYEMIITHENNTAKFMIDKGANINYLNLTGESSLKGAIQSQNREMLQYLMDRGADTTLLNSDEIEVIDSIYFRTRSDVDASISEGLGHSLEELDLYMQCQQTQNNPSLSESLTVDDSGYFVTESLEDLEQNPNTFETMQYRKN